ncbi:DUF2163 domain-containing protein [Maritimibacter sp. DP07]|uniref:DUF2163 domain-containing protein n=1 Tax=Maritimibacter harenae TaxID=2606218 RepID=A0A845M4U6_9RHOB|nr:DUF2163 domain-containing protein [Maritimibacter harenae]
MHMSEAFLDHLQGGLTTLARCWLLRRRDGWVRGFTDHDRDLAFDGVTFRAETGLTAHAIMQTTGLAIDNSEALGALSDAAVSEADIRAGRFDGAEVEAWLVNWADPAERVLQLHGTLGELTRAGGAFRAELLGLSEALNQPQGRVYQSACSAVLGDTRCGVDLDQPGFSETCTVLRVEDEVRLTLEGEIAQPERWFAKGRLRVLDGEAAGLTGVIKNDAPGAAGRHVELWQALRAPLAPGDRVRIEAGCDKRLETCRDRFANIVNFRGFPHVPGEDRLLSVPVTGTTVDTTGGGK